MEVVLDRDAFLKGLQMVQNIVEPRQTLPILANVLLETDGETIRVSATDLEVGARVTVPARVASKGAITISARKLSEIVKELPSAWLTLDAKALKEMLTHTSFAVSHDETRYALNGVLFVIQAKEMRVVATDGHRLAIAVRALGQAAV